MHRIVLLILVVCSIAMPFDAAAAKKEDLYKEIDMFAQALHFVRENYVEAPDDEKLLHGAIEGMLRTLDPHSGFMPPDVYKELKLDTEGRFGGIGIEVMIRDKFLTVISPIEGTPAMRAGIKGGDKVTKIDGKSTMDMPLSEAVKLMRGQKGTSVRLTVEREKLKPFEVVLKRDIIHIQSVRKAEPLGDGLAYIKINSFQQDTTRDLARELGKLEKDQKGIRGLVLDLRNNPGGLLNEAISVADEFLEEGVIVSTKGRAEPAHESVARKEGTHSGFPMIVIVNEGTASAAEIVAGALQDHGRGVILGVPTFGKGSVQTVFDVGRGAAIKLTVARYYTPKGRSIQAEGIEPDIKVTSEITKATAETPQRQLREKDLEQHLEAEEKEKKDSKKGTSIETKEDPQKEAAINYLRSWTIFGKK